MMLIWVTGLYLMVLVRWFLFVTRSLQRRKAVKRHPVCNTLDLIPPPSLSCSNNNVYVFVAKSLTPSLPFSSALPYVIMF